MMNKNFKNYSICWAILLVLFNLICFITPSELFGMTKFGGAFWAGYIFILLAFIGQIICTYFALKSENKQELFYKLPLINISYVGLVLTIICGVFCMVIPNLPNWIGIIVCLIILAFNVIAVIKASVAKEIVSNIDEDVKIQMSFIKGAIVQSQNIMSRAKSENIKRECKKIYERLRYSDPISNTELELIEKQIEANLSKLSEAVLSDDYDTTTEIVKLLVILIGDRNKKCKMLK